MHIIILCRQTDATFEKDWYKIVRKVALRRHLLQNCDAEN